MRPKFRIAAALALVLGLAGTPPSSPDALAGTAARLDVQGLVDGAELVVEGRVTGARARRDERGLVVTEYDLLVERTFLGEEATLRTVTLPGGVLPDGSGMLVAGLPRLRVGERSLLFLSEPRGPAGPRMPVGLSQGRVEVVDAPGGRRLAVRSHSQLALADPATGRVVEPDAVDVLDYAALVAEIRAAVSARGTGRRSAPR